MPSDAQQRKVLVLEDRNNVDRGDVAWYCFFIPLLLGSTWQFTQYMGQALVPFLICVLLGVGALIGPQGRSSQEITPKVAPPPKVASVIQLKPSPALTPTVNYVLHAPLSRGRKFIKRFFDSHGRKPRTRLAVAPRLANIPEE
ncbi:hypothetical protein V8F06_009562 [Rhypophila decipiens]